MHRTPNKIWRSLSNNLPPDGDGKLAIKEDKVDQNKSRLHDDYRRSGDVDSTAQFGRTLHPGFQGLKKRKTWEPLLLLHATCRSGMSGLLMCHEAKLKEMETNGAVIGLPKDIVDEPCFCEGCAMGKMTRKPFCKHERRHCEPGDFIHSDL